MTQFRPRTLAPLLALAIAALAFAPLSGAGYASPLPCAASTVSTTATSDNIHQVSVTAGKGRSIGEMHHAGSGIWITARYREATAGFDLWSMADPAAPVHLSSYNQTSSGTKISLDVKTTTDGKTALVGMYGGIELVDIRDTSKPVYEGRSNFPPLVATVGIPQNMAHMMYVYEMGGTDYVFTATQWNYGVYVAKVVGEPGSRSLQHLGVYMPFENPVLLGQHDMWATFDPALGKHVLYVADGFMGWAVADITDPAKPVTLGRGFETSAYQGYTHTVQAAFIDGRRIVATITEIGHNSLKVYDATDLSKAFMIGEWNWNPTSPVDAVEEQHNLQIVDGKLVMSHKWQGVFIFDLDALVAAVPPGTLGLPEPLSSWGPVAHWQPPALTPRVKVWDVVVKDGLIYTGDYGATQPSYQGIYVLQYGCWTPGDATKTSTG